jgi:hypothetical protein
MIVDDDHFVWAGRIAPDPFQKELVVPKLIVNRDNDA